MISRAATGIALLVIGYLAIGIPLAWHTRHLLLGDGFAYIQTARHYADGNLALALNGFWSPLFSWLLVPLLWLDADPLVAAHMLATGSGLLWVAGAWLLARRLELQGGWQLGCAACAGLMAIAASVRHLTPDVLSTGILLLYLYAVSSEDLFESRRTRVACGLLGGLAYLAKAFCGPFFLAHFTICVWLRSGAAGRRAALRCWLTGLGCAALLMGPWIGAISTHYGQLTISNAGKANHALVGPDDIHRWHPWASGLWPPPPGRLSVWEDPSTVPYRTWSPLASRQYLLHQLDLSLRNLPLIAEGLAPEDPLRLRLLALLLLTVGGLWRFPPPGRQRTLLLTLQCACVVHIGGYLPVWAGDTRYHYLLTVILTLYAIRLLRGANQRVLPILGLGYFGLTVLLWLTGHMLRVERGIEFQRVAEVMTRRGCRGPVASTDFRYGLYVATRLKLRALGQPQATDGEPLREELQAAGVRTFLLWDRPPIAERPWLTRVVHLPRGSLRGLRWGLTIYRVKPAPHPRAPADGRR